MGDRYGKTVALVAEVAIKISHQEVGCGCKSCGTRALANSADPDEMQNNAAFHPGHHCLPKYPFRGFQYTKG